MISGTNKVVPRPRKKLDSRLFFLVDPTGSALEKAGHSRDPKLSIQIVARSWEIP